MASAIYLIATRFWGRKSLAALTASKTNSRLSANSYSADRVDAHIGANFIHVERNRSFYLYVTFFRDAEPLAWISNKRYENYTEDAEVESRGRLYLHRGSILCDLTLGIKPSKRAMPLLITFWFNENFKIASLNTRLSMVNGTIDGMYVAYDQFGPDPSFSVFDVRAVCQNIVRCCGRSINLIRFEDDPMIARSVSFAQCGRASEGASSPIPYKTGSERLYADEDVPF